VELVEDCVALPLLLGSRFEDTYPVADGLTIVVSGNRDDITVSVQGAAADSSTTLDVLQLGGGNTPVLSVRSDDGEQIEVFVREGCF
jgi:hypothetical protein